MKQLTPMARALRSPRARLAAALFTTLALVVGCGGGGSEATSGTTGIVTPSDTTVVAYTQGTITGFGSVIVNGVRFDDSAASVTDDDGSKQALSVLRLGMRVEVDSGTVDKLSATAKAVALRFGGLVTGPVSAVDTTANTLTVLGQVVDVTSTTVFDDTLAAGLSAVTTGAVVEVHGLRDAATGHIVATRVEPESTATAYKLRGTVASLNTTAKTFSIGGAAISYAGVATVPTTLADGVSLRVTLATAAVSGVWQATSLGIKAARTDTLAQAHLRGAITAFTSTTAFTVDGIVVDATNATFPDGTTGLALGAQVEVEGTLSNGVLVATKVGLESRHTGDDSRRYELHGAITAIDTTAKTFVLRGVTVNYAGTVSYVGGTEAGLVVGAKVEVKGAVGSTRTQVVAATIKFES